MFPTDPTQASAYQRLPSKRHVIFTAETHNFPTGQELASTRFLNSNEIKGLTASAHLSGSKLSSLLRSRSIQRCHYRNWGSNSGCPEHREGRARHRRDRGILLRKPAHSRWIEIPPGSKWNPRNSEPVRLPDPSFSELSVESRLMALDH